MFKKLFIASTLLFIATACSLEYKFNGASIDYSKTKTISIKDFKNLAPLINPTLAPTFNEGLRDIYSKQTRLKTVNNNGDLQLEGEITNYDLTPMSIKANAIAAETRLSVTIKVRFTNKSFPDKSFERQYSAFQNFDNSKTLNQVQDELCKLIIDEICERIYNETVADW